MKAQKNQQIILIIDKNYSKLKKEIDDVHKLENEIKTIQNNNNNFEFKTINFPIKKLYKDLKKMNQ